MGKKKKNRKRDEYIAQIRGRGDINVRPERASRNRKSVIDGCGRGKGETMENERENDSPCVNGWSKKVMNQETKTPRIVEKEAIMPMFFRATWTGSWSTRHCPRASRYHPPGTVRADRQRSSWTGCFGRRTPSSQRCQNGHDRSLGAPEQEQAPQM